MCLPVSHVQLFVNHLHIWCRYLLGRVGDGRHDLNPLSRIFQVFHFLVVFLNGGWHCLVAIRAVDYLPEPLG